MLVKIFKHFFVNWVFELRKRFHCFNIGSVADLPISIFVIKIVLEVLNLKVCVSLFQVPVQLKFDGSYEGVSRFLWSYVFILWSKLMYL